MTYKTMTKKKRVKDKMVAISAVSAGTAMAIAIIKLVEWVDDPENEVVHP